MAGAFDPYHRWLGIPREEQPPHYYRLLGLAPFEDDPEVVRDAAERQMAHVRNYAIGRHGDLSQKILNELALAKTCLLDPDKKADYDGRLQAERAATVSASLPPPLENDARIPPRPVPAPPPIGSTPPPLQAPGARAEARAGASQSSSRRSLANFRRKRLVTAVGVAVGLLLIVLLGALTIPGGKDKTPLRRDGRQPPVSAPVRAGLKLRPIEEQVVNEGEELSFLVQVENPGLLGDELRYRLGPGAPEGAAIDAATGRFVWTPAEKQGPAVYTITVQAATEGASASGQEDARATFHVDVREVNQPPVVQALGDQIAQPGKPTTFVVPATDPDQPPNRLKFSLASAPAWLKIDPAHGTVTGVPTEAEAGWYYRVTVRVTDDGRPTLAAERSVNVAVPKTAGPPGTAGGALFAAQQAIASGDAQKAWEHLQAAQAAAASYAELQPLQEFLRAVHEQFGKVAVLDQLALDSNVIASVVERNGDRLCIMWQGRPRYYTESELPWQLAVALAEKGLPQGDARGLAIAAFLAADVRGDNQEFVRRSAEAGLTRSRTRQAPSAQRTIIAPGQWPNGQVPAPPASAGAMQQTPPSAPAPTARQPYSITLPSGQTVDSSLFDVDRQSVIREADSQLQSFFRGVDPRSPHGYAGLLHPNGSVLAVFRYNLARRVVDQKFDGVLIAFYPGGPALASFASQAAAMTPGPAGMTRWPATRVSASSPTGTGLAADLDPKLYVNYDNGKKSGWLKSWDEEFRKRYWCEYAADRRNGLCLMFEADELAMVLECKFDAVEAIHWISGGKLGRSFQDEGAVKGDAAAGPIWERLLKVQAELDEEERSIEKKRKEELGKWMEAAAQRLNVLKRGKMLDSIDQHGQQATDALREKIRKSTGR